MNIILLGSGNVATHLGRVLKMAGHTILQVWSRNEVNATALATQLAAEQVSSISSLKLTADLYIIAVKDNAIREVAAALPFHDRPVVHTSGTTDLSVLAGVSSAIGVLYPIQTFSKTEEINFKNVPIAIEANTVAIANLLRTVAEDISNKVVELNSNKRATLHMAAVFACNFTNYLYTVAQQILEEEQLNFDLIRPLIAETAAKVQTNAPRYVQTGPAVREDKETMNKHVELLKDDSEYLELYRILSQGIVNCHKLR